VALNAHGGTSEGETVCVVLRRVTFTGNPEGFASYAKVCEGRSRRKAFWIVRNVRSSPGAREAVLTCR